MRKNTFLSLCIWLLLPIVALADLQHAISQHTTPENLNPSGYNMTFSKSGNSYIAGQPDLASIATLKDLGITAVVSLRTPGEMSDVEEVPYDEAGAVTSQGLNYISIPMNGRADYSEDMLKKFISTYDQHGGRVLLHCKSGVRASQMWTAFLVKHEGMELEAARKIGETISLKGAPMNGLLGIKSLINTEPDK